jgi:hypothetical protein
VEAASSLCNKASPTFFHLVVASSGAGVSLGWDLVRSGDQVGASDLPALYFLIESGSSFEAPDLVGEFFCPSLVFSGPVSTIPSPTRL